MPLTLSGELKVAAYADLGGLGASQGPAVPYVWALPSLMPLLLPWLAVLALLALPANRELQAWLIWVPLAGLAAVGAALPAVVKGNGQEALAYSLQTACAAAFGFAAVWLVATTSSNRRSRWLKLALLALAMTAASLLAFVVTPVWEQLWDSRQWLPGVLLYALLFWMIYGVVLIGGLRLTGWMCRNRFGGLRVVLLLALWLLVLWLVAGGIVGGVVALVNHESFEWLGLLTAGAVLTLGNCIMLLPFLLLSFSNSFYRQRLRILLGPFALQPETSTTTATDQRGD